MVAGRYPGSPSSVRTEVELDGEQFELAEELKLDLAKWTSVVHSA